MEKVKKTKRNIEQMIEDFEKDPSIIRIQSFAYKGYVVTVQRCKEGK